MAKPRRNMAAAVQNKAAEVISKAAAAEKAPVVEAAPAVEKAPEAVKAPAAEKAAEADKAPAAKPAPAKAEVEKSVFVEFGGKQLKVKEVLAQAEKAYEESHTGTEVKSIELYISPEQNAAYYVVNGEASEDFKIEL